MGYKDHEKISEEAVKLLEPLLADYYKKPFDEGYSLLRRKIKVTLLGKHTGAKYKPILIDDLEDLTSAVIIRLISINDKSLKETEEKIRDPESMAVTISGFVYKEWWKAVQKRGTEQLADENDPENKTPPLPQPVDNEIQAIRREIIQKCSDDCVEQWPDEKKAIFRAYYPRTRLTPAELVEARRQLAYRVAGLTQQEVQSMTPEQAERVLNNLQSRVNKWRKNEFEECVKACVEASEAKHPRLNYLSQR